MGKMGRRRKFNNKALSDVVGFIMILAIVVIAIAIVLFWYTPYRDRMEAESQVKSISHQFYGIDDAVTDLISQGKNATTFTRIAMNKGDINVLSGDERIVIYYTIVNESMNVHNYNFIARNLEDDDFSFEISKVQDPQATSNSINALITGRNLYDSLTYDTDNVEIKDNEWIRVDLPNINSIEGAVNISLYDANKNDALFGKIWVFDLGAIVYNLPSSFGDYKVSYQNGAVHVTYAGVDPAIIESPTIINETDSLFLQISSITPVLSTAVSAPNTIKLSMEVNNTFPCEVLGNTSFLKMQIFGNYFESWRIYFTLNYGFNDVSSAQLPNTLEIPGDFVYFSLSHTEINAYVEGVT